MTIPITTTRPVAMIAIAGTSAAKVLVQGDTRARHPQNHVIEIQPSYGKHVNSFTSSIIRLKIFNFSKPLRMLRVLLVSGGDTIVIELKHTN